MISLCLTFYNPPTAELDTNRDFVKLLRTHSIIKYVGLFRLCISSRKKFTTHQLIKHSKSLLKYSAESKLNINICFPCNTRIIFVVCKSIIHNIYDIYNNVMNKLLNYILIADFKICSIDYLFLLIFIKKFIQLRGKYTWNNLKT